MKDQSLNKYSITFSTPDPTNGIISVFKSSPDRNIEIIGKIFPEYNPELGYTSYAATNLEGGELYPFTSDFTEIENRFLQHAKEQSEKSFTEAMLLEAELQSERKNSLHSLRNFKLNKLFKTKSINY